MPPGAGSHPPAEIRLFPHSCIQAGERGLGIANLRCYEGKSYSSPLLAHPDIPIRVIHCNGRPPNLSEGDHDILYLMTCSLLSTPVYLKVIIREGISKLCPPELVPASYEALRFFSAQGEPGTTGFYLLVGL